MPRKPQPTKAAKVFYSYSHKDEKLRDLLETHLALLKRRRVISTWHDRRIGAGDEWAGAIDEHLKTADIILLLVSANFLASKYCYDVELKLAMKRHRAGDAVVIPIILRPCELTGAPFGKLESLPKDRRAVTKWPNRDDAFTDIANGIRNAAAELVTKSKAAEKTNAATGEKIGGPGVARSASTLIPRPPVIGFVARRDEQGRDIVERLTEELLPENNQLVALWGPGGTGKTTLAAEVVRATADVFKGRAVWVSALGRAEFNLAALLDETATQLGREDLRRLAPELKSAEVGALVGAQPTLVVLDNFETIAEEEQTRCLDFLAQSAACPALITTRSFANRDDVSNVPLAAMSMEEARDFLQRLIERIRKPSNFNKLDRDELIQNCEANPLVLQWVVRQIDLAKRPQDVLNALAQGEGDAAARVFTRSFNLPQVGNDGRAALLALALFTPDASREALAQVSGFGDGIHRLNKAVESLSALWLIEATEGNERLFLRGLTRELAKSRLTNDLSGNDFRRRYVAYFLHHIEAHVQETPEDLDSLEAEKDNLLGAIDAAFGCQDWGSAIRIRSLLNHFFLLRGYWDEAIRSGELVVKAAREMSHEENAAIFAANVALIRRNRGEHEKAGRIYREALKIFEEFRNDVNAAACLNQLGVIERNLGNFKEARQFFNKSLKIRKRLGDQRAIALTIWGLGNVAIDQENMDEAKKLLTKALKIFTNLKDKANAAGVLHQLAVVADYQGDLSAAQRLFGESLEISRKLGSQSDSAFALYNSGLLAEKEGKKTEAVRLFREALLIYEKLGSPAAEDARRHLARLGGNAV